MKDYNEKLKETIILRNNLMDEFFEDNKNYESWWDEMIDFSKELTELIYTDLKNPYLFITENKNYIIFQFFWIYEFRFI